MSTFDEGIATARDIAAEYGMTWVEMRRFAIGHMEASVPNLEEIGTSDVSHHLAMLANTDPERLHKEGQAVRERNELVARVAGHTGRSQEETLTNLRALLAPLDEV